MNLIKNNKFIQKSKRFRRDIKIIVNMKDFIKK